MPFSNAQQEDEWVRAWNELYELVGDRREVTYLTPEFRELTQDEALGWLQDAAYTGSRVEVAEAWYQGRKAIRVQREEV